jgi:hypothetical protein
MGRERVGRDRVALHFGTLGAIPTRVGHHSEPSIYLCQLEPGMGAGKYCTGNLFKYTLPNTYTLQFCLRVNRTITGTIRQWWSLIDTYFDFYARYGVTAGSEQLLSTAALSAHIRDQLLADFDARQVDVIGRFRRSYVNTWFGSDSQEEPGWFLQIHDR